MNLFSRSNQNGAPSESARAVTSQPMILKSHPCQLIFNERGSPSALVQPMGNPSFWICARFCWIRHSGEFLSVAQGSAFVEAVLAGPLGVAVAVGAADPPGLTAAVAGGLAVGDGLLFGD